MGDIVRYAQAQDAEKLISFLQEASLGTEGVEESIDFFLILEDEVGNINGTLGIEPLGSVGLLRSLVITDKADEKALLAIFEQMLQLARKKQFDSLYLATNKQASLHFFTMLGFEIEEDKGKLPKELFHSEHVKHILTVDNSRFMKLSMK